MIDAPAPTTAEQFTTRTAFILFGPEMAGYSPTDRRVLAAVAAMMHGQWPDVTFDNLVEGAEDVEPVDAAYLLNLVSFHWAARGSEVADTAQAVNVVGQMHQFPYSAHGLIDLVRRYQERHGEIWTPEVRDA